VIDLPSAQRLYHNRRKDKQPHQTSPKEKA
jgi:hypothetical protein